MPRRLTSRPPKKAAICNTKGIQEEDSGLLTLGSVNAG